MNETEHTRTPLTDDQVKTIRSMSLYWQEVRRRDDRSPLDHEAHQLVSMLGNNQLLRMAEFCVDPVRLAALDLLTACKAALLLMGQSSKIDWDDEVTPVLEAAIAKATPAEASP